MESILVKIFATGLALSQVMTTPDDIKTEFDANFDQPVVADLLHRGCNHMLKAFDLENINFDELLEIALDDPEAIGEKRAFRGIDFTDLLIAYRQFCKQQPVERPAVDLAEVIAVYNKAAANLPDHTKLKGLKLPGASVVLDQNGDRFAEVFEENQRRVWVVLDDIPLHVQNAFVSAEDKRFHQHKGVDEHGLIRAFIANLTQSGRPQGGSTITQQIVKNLLVGDDLSFERKIREVLVASRVETALTKAEILELYLNSVYLGRSAWGIELAARSYFGKPANELTVEEGAFLAGLTKGPNFYNPDRHPIRARERLAYVLSRMREDGATQDLPLAGRNLPRLPSMVAYERPRRDTGFHFVDQVAREAKALAGIDTITADSYAVHSTLHPKLQRVVEATLQEGLWRYERNTGRLQFRNAEANLSKAIHRIEAKTLDPKPPAWQQALANARLPLYDVHWTPAVVLEKPGTRKNQRWRVGLADGRIVPLSVDNAVAARKLVLNDVVFVNVTEARGKAVRAELRIRPTVQGAVVALENKTGRILAMSGGFSYPLSQLNRSTQSVRQPGSAIKPLSYLAALGNGLQPNTWVSDGDLTLPPIGPGPAREKDYWSPRNYGGGSGGTLTLRRALENSRNLATAHLLVGGIDKTPEASLDRLCKLALEARIYHECLRFYPFILGSQPVRPIDLAAFYAAIANEGWRPTPYVIDSIERNGETIYRHKADDGVDVDSVDHAAFYQLKSIMQGVLARGTARSIAALAPYVAGKTGTSDDENDAWFVGFTNEVTVAVWVGYDNAGGKRRTLGGGSTGGGLAVPIFAPIIQAVWADVTPKTVLAPPSAEAKRLLSCKSIDVKSGEIASSRRRGGVSECFRVDAKGRIIDTQDRLLEAQAKNDDERPRRRTRAVRREDPRYYYNYSHEVWRGYGWYNDRRGWRSQRNWGGWGWR